MGILFLTLICLAMTGRAYGNIPSFKSFLDNNAFLLVAYSMSWLLLSHTLLAAFSFYSLDRSSDLWRFGFLLHALPISALAILGNTAGIGLKNVSNLRMSPSKGLFKLTMILAGTVLVSGSLFWAVVFGSQLIRVWQEESTAGIITVLVLMLAVIPVFIVATCAILLLFIKYGRLLSSYLNRRQVFLINSLSAILGYCFGYLIR